MIPTWRYTGKDFAERLSEDISRPGSIDVPVASPVAPPVTTAPLTAQVASPNLIEQKILGGLGFTMSAEGKGSPIALNPDENILRFWRVENSEHGFFKTIEDMLTCTRLKTFSTLFVTNERVILKTDYYHVEKCISKVFESQSSFKLRDLSYINVQEVGPKLCGCISAKTQIELRFGRYPKSDEFEAIESGTISSAYLSLYIYIYIYML